MYYDVVFMVDRCAEAGDSGRRWRAAGGLAAQKIRKGRWVFILSMRAKYAYFKWREAKIGIEIRLKIREKYH